MRRIVKYILCFLITLMAIYKPWAPLFDLEDCLECCSHYQACDQPDLKHYGALYSAARRDLSVLMFLHCSVAHENQDKLKISINFSDLFWSKLNMCELTPLNGRIGPDAASLFTKFIRAESWETRVKKKDTQISEPLQSYLTLQKL